MSDSRTPMESHLLRFFAASAARRSALGAARWACAALVVTACGSAGPQRVDDADRESETVGVDVTLDPATRSLMVQLDLPAPLGPAVQLPFHGGPFGEQRLGYEAFARTLDGAAMPDELPVPAGGARLSYRVELRHADSEPLAGPDEVPHPTAGGWFLVGRAFLPVIKSGGVRTRLPGRVTLHVPPGWEVLSSAGDGTVVRGPLPALRDAFYYVGRFHHRRVTMEGAVVDVATADWPPSSLDVLESVVRRVHGVASSKLGPLSGSRRLVVYDRVPQGFFGGVVGMGLSVLSSTPPTERVRSAAGEVLVHELMHQWIVGETTWLAEGLTTYMQVLTQAELDGALPQQLADAIAEIARRYLAGAGDGSIGDGSGPWGYAAGATVGFCLDAALAGQGATVASVLRATRGELGAGAALTVADFTRVLGRTSAEAAARLAQWLEAPQAIDVAGCFDEAGYDAQEVEYRGYSLRSLALDVLRAPSFSPQRAELFRVREGSPFEVGDVIEAVDGQRVGRVDDLSWLLRDVAAGATVRADVLRRGAATVVEFVMPDVAPDQRPRQVRLTATPR